MYPPGQRGPMRTEASYAIIQAPTPESLQQTVAEAMAKGFGIAGGAFVAPVQAGVTGPSGVMWCQTVYRIVERPLTPEEVERLTAEERKSELVT